jgi:AcrR family transcriptional regulator
VASTLAQSRLEQLMAAALEVFRTKGFRRAQVADVARAMGVSQGTIYNYVESKEALLYLLLDRALGGGPLDGAELPVPTPSREVLAERLRERLVEHGQLPRLRAALGRPSVPDAAGELEGIVREIFGRTAAIWPWMAVLERSAVDVPEIAELYFQGARRQLIADLTRYLELRMAAGQLRAVPDPATTARLVLEVIAWFAWHRHEDPDSSSITDVSAEESVVDFICGSLVRTAGRPKSNAG